jgi:hypothetical protein
VVDCWVCTGKDCSRSKGHADLVREATDRAKVDFVRCQKICSGPVIGTEVDGRIEWFEEVRGRKSRRDVLRLTLGEGGLSDRLRRRRVAKRAGRLRT